MTTSKHEEQKTIDELQKNWIWAPNWVDSSQENTAGRVVKFTRRFDLSTTPEQALLHFSADTRYKLYINGIRIAVGPTRGSPLIWYYDTLNIAPYLRQGSNEIEFAVVRYFATVRGAMPFGRTSFPGLTVVGAIETPEATIDLNSREGWSVCVDNSIRFPMGLVDDVFLHIYERVEPTSASNRDRPRAYGMGTLNGDLLPWRLKPRVIPMPETSRATISAIRACNSDTLVDAWMSFFSSGKPLTLRENTRHELDLQAEVHTTAFLEWCFRADKATKLTLKTTYSEGYELEPRSYPFFRVKKDRLDSTNGHIIGPFDEVTLKLPNSQTITWEPFWFRTFRLMRIELIVGPGPVVLEKFKATQTNYPLAVKASWYDADDADSSQIWDVSIRTLRNCMFDGYSDCPFYEQLQYSGDSRSVGLFHYLLSGDDRLMRQAITNFAASVIHEGLTQSRFPSHVPQIIAGFSLYWILQVCDHYLYFGDRSFSRSFLPRIDGVLDFFDSHIDKLGLVSHLPADVWQYVDWVTTWGATDEHPDKGVPTSGRKSNRHTYFSLLYAMVLKRAAQLTRDVGRAGHASEYEERAVSLVKAIQTHCYDGRFYTDSTADIADDQAYSQHCQVFAVLAGVVQPEDRRRILYGAFAIDSGFSKCSYVMRFYALRAFALAGDDAYESFWQSVWDPWRNMLANNLSTWEEDDVRQRSDCHAWGAVPIYEYCTELAGICPIAPGCAKIAFAPRLKLSREIQAKVALGRDNVASVAWITGIDGSQRVKLHLDKAVEVQSRLPGGQPIEHGIVDQLELTYKRGAQ